MEPPQKKRKGTPADDIEPLTDAPVWPPTPVLRLRPTVPSEWLEPAPGIVKGPDGPLIPHPGWIRDREPGRWNRGQYPLDISMDQYRERWRACVDEFLATPMTLDEFNISWVMDIHPLADMEKMDGRTDEDIALAVERTYTGALRFVMLRS